MKVKIRSPTHDVKKLDARQKNKNNQKKKYIHYDM